MTDAAVTVEVAAGVARVMFNRPERANAFDLPMAHAFGAALDRAAEDDVRVVLLTGSGRRFCAGGDVSSFLAGEDPGAYLLKLATVLEAHVRRLSTLPKPVVAAVQGAAAGAGLAFVLSADIVISAPGAKFSMAYANIGLTPDCGVSYLLPRVVGLRRALALTLMQRTLVAQEAEDWGLVSALAEDPIAAAAELAASIATAPAVALGHARKLLRAAYDLPREQHALEEAGTIAASVQTPEAVALIQAFTSR
jgi:2-(1,2-epoxy-1,2-dihydrophenyl)acetyl-CoA isomerase